MDEKRDPPVVLWHPNREELFRRINEVGGWPIGFKFLNMEHTVCPDRRCTFSNTRVRDEWCTSILEEDDYLLWRLPDGVLENIRYDICRAPAGALQISRDCVREAGRLRVSRPAGRRTVLLREVVRVVPDRFLRLDRFDSRRSRSVLSSNLLQKVVRRNYGNRIASHRSYRPIVLFGGIGMELNEFFQWIVIFFLVVCVLLMGVWMDCFSRALNTLKGFLGSPLRK